MSLATEWEPPVTVRVPAKINLDLRVGPPRADGFHELATVFHAVDVCDLVTVASSEQAAVHPYGPYGDAVPADSSNLVLKAWEAATKADSSGSSPAIVHVEKNIPVAAGLAGGSADAAATIVALDHLWGAGWDDATHHSLAAGLGSDVNFALVGGTALGTGRGERIAPILVRGTYHWVLAVSHEGLSTAEVFAALDRQRGKAEVPPPTVGAELLAALRSGDAAVVGQHLHNDFHPVVDELRPELAQLRELGLREGALGAVVSGSGPTVAFLTAGAEQALDLSVILAASRLCDDVLRVTGPVAGAHVVPGVVPPVSAPRLRAVPNPQREDNA